MEKIRHELEQTSEKLAEKTESLSQTQASLIKMQNSVQLLIQQESKYYFDLFNKEHEEVEKLRLLRDNLISELDAKVEAIANLEEIVAEFEKKYENVCLENNRLTPTDFEGKPLNPMMNIL